jgi:hypothetical protein
MIAIPPNTTIFGQELLLSFLFFAVQESTVKGGAQQISEGLAEQVLALGGAQQL